MSRCAQESLETRSSRRLDVSISFLSRTTSFFLFSDLSGEFLLQGQRSKERAKVVRIYYTTPLVSKLGPLDIRSLTHSTPKLASWTGRDLFSLEHSINCFPYTHTRFKQDAHCAGRGSNLPVQRLYRELDHLKYMPLPLLTRLLFFMIFKDSSSPFQTPQSLSL